MIDLVFLDSGPLSMIAHPKASPENLRCRAWASGLVAAGVRLFVPEIVDFEVRRELLRVGATTGLARLDRIKAGLEYAPLSTDVMLQAAKLWAEVRRRGLPTADSQALDGDAILAAQALAAAGPGQVVVATDNVGHLGRFVDARPWEQVTA